MSDALQRPVSYYTVRRVGSAWDVQLVTPCPGEDIRTTLARASHKEPAIEHGQELAARMKREFRMPK